MTTPATQIKKLKYYTSDSHLYVNMGEGYSSYSPLTDLTRFKINDKFLEHTHHPTWFKVEGEAELKSLTVYCSPRTINQRYEIIDPAYVKDGVPAVLSLDDVQRTHGDDGYVWNNPLYAPYKRLYDLKSDKSEPTYEPMEFEADFVAHLSTEVIEPGLVKYNIAQERNWKTEIVELDLSKVAYYGELDVMLQEPLLIHNVPCSVSSRVAYDIIRQYVKENINSSSAVVTSDYDFCFTVKRKIIVKPYETRHETRKANGRSYATPKIKTYRHTHKEVELFEMTHEEKRYSGYTVIKGFKGENLNDLAENIKLYLDELMAHINSQFTECENCNGAGVIVGEPFGINVHGDRL